MQRPDFKMVHLVLSKPCCLLSLPLKLGLALKWHQRAVTPFYNRGDNTEAESSSQLLSWCLNHEQNPTSKTPLGGMCHLTVPAVTVPACCQLCPACSCANAPAPLPARDTTAGKTGAASHVAGVKPQNQDPQSVCMLVASKCWSASSDTGTAAVIHTTQSNVGHDTNTPVLLSEASGHRSSVTAQGHCTTCWETWLHVASDRSFHFCASILQGFTALIIIHRLSLNLFVLLFTVQLTRMLCIALK